MGNVHPFSRTATFVYSTAGSEVSVRQELSDSLASVDVEIPLEGSSVHRPARIDVELPLEEFCPHACSEG